MHSGKRPQRQKMWKTNRNLKKIHEFEKCEFYVLKKCMNLISNKKSWFKKIKNFEKFTRLNKSRWVWQKGCEKRNKQRTKTTKKQ